MLNDEWMTSGRHSSVLIQHSSFRQDDPRTNYRATDRDPQDARPDAVRTRHRPRRTAGAAEAGHGRPGHAGLPGTGQGAHERAEVRLRLLGSLLTDGVALRRKSRLPAVAPRHPASHRAW